jgi:hypothetical protein
MNAVSRRAIDTDIATMVLMGLQRTVKGKRVTGTAAVAIRSNDTGFSILLQSLGQRRQSRGVDPVII